ncbi:MAG: hypothetical protein ACK5RA_13245, partial [Cyanobacteriota bacterium]
GRQVWLAWWAFHLSDSFNDCPTTSCTRPDAWESLFGDGGHGRVMLSVTPQTYCTRCPSPATT